MNEIITWLMENYITLIVWVLIIGAVVMFIRRFTALTPSQQMDRVRLAMLWMVTEAEKALGSKTGKIKRAAVYAAIQNKFPFISIIIPQSVFDKMLDGALDEFKILLESNDTLYKYVYGKNRDGSALTAEELSAIDAKLAVNAEAVEVIRDLTATINQKGE